MSSLFRLLRIALALSHFAFDWATEQLHLSVSGQKPPQRLCLVFARLGPAFIKFGQALSMRRDLLPDAYAAALLSLQDHIAPFPAREAISEIEHAFGRPVNQLFARFDEMPFAAASIAQVHTATLQDGREVIVKVRRIGIAAQIDRDMRALSLLARIAIKLVPRLEHYQPSRLVEEIWKNLRKEIDFRREARNSRRFSAVFADWPTIHIPGMIDDLVRETVIVQERSRGQRIDDPVLRSDGPRLAQHFVEAYLHQIFVLGLFHGDPHPGNLFIMADGRICFHDFGLVGSLDLRTRRRLAVFTNAFLHQDADWLLDSAIDLGILGGDMNRDEFRSGLSEIIADYAALPLKEWSLADAFLRVARLGQSQNVLVPYDLVILMRAMFLAENTVRTLDPDFQLLQTLQSKGPEVLKTALEMSAGSMSLERLKQNILATVYDFPGVLTSWLRRIDREGNSLALNVHIQDFGMIQKHKDRSHNRLALGLVSLGLYIAGSLLTLGSIGPRLYDDVPVFGAVAFALAFWFTFRLVRGIARSGGL